MLKRYMHNREKYFAMLTDNRIVRPFEWGAEHVGVSVNGGGPGAALTKYAADWVANSSRYFSLEREPNYSFDETFGNLSWRSSINSDWPENNTVRAKYFPATGNKKVATLILPHWNSQPGTYFDLAKLLNRFGISGLRLTLPYHEERMPNDLERADYLVAPNIGLTLQAVRQAALDTLAAVRWLKNEGFEKVGIVGTSIGSCTAFLAFTHSLDIDVGVFNHVSGYFSDVVWNGLSTYHVRESLEKQVTLEELRAMWLPISPMAYIDRLANLPPRPQQYIYTLYDLTFPIDLSRETMAAMRKHKIRHKETVLPCGHYTLGQKPWNYIDGFKIVSFLRKYLR